MRNRRPFKRPRREGATHAKLTWAVVREIRALKGQRSSRQLAAQFGVCRETVDNVLAGRTWREPLTIDQGRQKRAAREPPNPSLAQLGRNARRLC
jgi:hypothetical protein